MDDRRIRDGLTLTASGRRCAYEGPVGTDAEALEPPLNDARGSLLERYRRAIEPVAEYLLDAAGAEKESAVRRHDGVVETGAADGEIVRPVFLECFPRL